MTRRPTPDRLAAEAALPAVELTTLRAQAAMLGIPVERWHRAHTFAAHWGTVAVLYEAETIRERDGLSRDEAQARAATKIGLSSETVRTRLRRGFREAFGL